MRNWKFWDWTAYACLGVAAIGMAVGETLKENPAMFESLPTLFLGPKWAYAPIILFALGSAILAVRVIVPLAAKHPITSDRVVVDATPEDLLSLGKDRTTLERNKITKAYIGKWLKVYGQVSDVTAYGRGAVVTVTMGDQQQQIELVFNAQWFERVTILMIGKNITAIGQIIAIYRRNIELQNCELIESGAK